MQPDTASSAPSTVDAPPVPLTSSGIRPLLWVVVAVVVVADQVTKWLVQQAIPVYGAVTVVPGLLDLVHIHNAGVAFGVFNDAAHPYLTAFTTGLALAALAAIVYYARHIEPSERWARAGLSLIMGGAIGNLIDRVRLGHVIDFIDVYRGDWHFWAFNVADAAISCGAVLIFLELFRTGGHASHPV
jgi:signal peptidase II